MIPGVRRGMVAITGAAMLAGCTSTTAGRAAPAPHDPEPGPSTSEAPSSPAGPLELSNTQLCDLLTVDEAGQLGGGARAEAGYSVSSGHPQCSWLADTSLVITFAKNGQSKDVKGGPNITNTPTTVAGLSAVLSKEVDVVESCQLIVDVTDRSVLSFLAGVHDSGKGRYETCDVATKLANIVIPKVKQQR